MKCDSLTARNLWNGRSAALVLAARLARTNSPVDPRANLVDPRILGWKAACASIQTGGIDHGTAAMVGERRNKRAAEFLANEHRGSKAASRGRPARGTRCADLGRPPAGINAHRRRIRAKATSYAHPDIRHASRTMSGCRLRDVTAGERHSGLGGSEPSMHFIYRDENRTLSGIGLWRAGR
jgi:hypothetical protein